MTTTLNAIRAHSPCQDGWVKLLKHLGKTQGDDEPLSLLTVLDSNGLNDAIWCLQTEPTPERTQRFTLAVARRVEHLHPAAKAYNDVTERYLNGTATKVELSEARAAAAHGAAHTAYAAADAAAAAVAAVAAVAAAYCAGEAFAAAYCAVRAACCADEADWAGEAETEAQVEIFKEIFG